MNRPDLYRLRWSRAERKAAHNRAAKRSVQGLQFDRVWIDEIYQWGQEDGQEPPPAPLGPSDGGSPPEAPETAPGPDTAV